MSDREKCLADAVEAVNAYHLGSENMAYVYARRAAHYAFLARPDLRGE